MTKKELEEMGLPKEQVDAITKKNGEDIEKVRRCDNR